MSTDSLSRDFYDLNYERSRRRRRPIVQGGKMSGAPDGLEVTTVPLDPLNIRLNRLSKAIQNILRKKDAFATSFKFLNCAIETPKHESVYAAMPPAAARALPSRPDCEQEEELLTNRLEWSKMDPITEKVLGHSLELLGDLVRLRQGECDNTLGYPDFFYRLHSSESHTFYVDGLGFQCARWICQRNFERPSAQDFSDHCNGEKSFHSPYISMTESPWRLLQFARYEPSTADVCIIDAKRLRATRIQFERTTELAQQWDIRFTGGQGRAQVQYVTATHWVAEGWIPQDCIAKRVPLGQFRKICMTKGISTGREKACTEELRLELRDFDKVAPRGPRRKVRMAPAQVLEEDQNGLARQTEGLSIHPS